MAIDAPEVFDSEDEGPESTRLFRTRITINYRIITLFIISIHLSCAFSRPVYAASGNLLLLSVASASWLIYATLVTGLIVLLYRRKGALVNTDMILLPAISLMWIISIGIITTVLGWVLGISNPIQWWTTGYISLILSMVLFLSYSARSQLNNSVDISFENPTLSIVTVSILLILSSVIGPLILNLNGSNSMSMLALLMVSTLPIIVYRGGVAGDYLAIYASSLSLLLLHSLVSEGVVGTDIFVEHYFANLVLSEGHIGLSLGHRYSTVLSTQLILPILSMWTGMPLVQTMKITYPLIYAFAPVLLYFSYSQVFPRDVSFFGALLTAFSFPFYISMLNVLRQGFAEIFFLSAIALVFSSDSLRMYRLRILVIPFLIMMTLSHYSINYILYPILWSSFAAASIIKFLMPSAVEEEVSAFRRVVDDDDLQVFQLYDDILLDEEGLLTLEELQDKVLLVNPLINFRQLVVGSIFVFVWHMIAGGGVVIETVQAIYTQSLETVVEQGAISSVLSTQPTEIVTTTLEPLHQITKILYILLAIASLPPMLSIIREGKISRPGRNSLTLAIGAWIFFVPVFLLPQFALRLEFQRIFHWLLMFLAPYSILGLKWFHSSINSSGEDIADYVSDRFVPSTMCIFLLLSSGFIYQFSDESHRAVFDSEMPTFTLEEDEEYGALWLFEHHSYDSLRPCIWADKYNGHFFAKYYGVKAFGSFGSASESTMLFIGEENTRDEGFYLLFRTGQEAHENFLVPFDEFPQEIFIDGSVVYDSGSSLWMHQGDCKIPDEVLSAVE